MKYAYYDYIIYLFLIYYAHLCYTVFNVGDNFLIVPWACIYSSFHTFKIFSQRAYERMLFCLSIVIALLKNILKEVRKLNFYSKICKEEIIQTSLCRTLMLQTTVSYIPVCFVTYTIKQSNFWINHEEFSIVLFFGDYLHSLQVQRNKFRCVEKLIFN